MTHFFRHVTSRNPVWMVPLALPVVLYASQTVYLAVLFTALVAIAVPTVHGVSYFAERWLPRHLRLVSLLLVAAVVVTILERILQSLGDIVPQRTHSMIQALTVTAIMVWPTIAAPVEETFRHRMAVAAGLAAGFVVGFVPLAAVRILLSRGGYLFADTLFVGFLLLAVGRMAINLYRIHSGEERA